MTELEHLEQAIAALEAQRSLLGDAVVDTGLAVLKEKQAQLVKDRQGQALASDTPASLQAQRKQVTVLFADISGFTSMSQAVDAEDVTEAVNTLWDTVDRVIVRYGGMIDKHMGDAVMALWGADTSREDNPERAVHAALAVQQAVNSMDLKLSGVSIGVRVGVHTGPVFLGKVGIAGEYTAMGDTVNVVSRLQRAAPVGGTLISYETYQQVRGAFQVQALEPFHLEGRPDPLQVFLVLQVKPRAFRMSGRGVEGIETHMIGRQAELNALQQTWQRVTQESRRQMITIVGEAGIGKSRLLYEFENWLELLPERVRYFKGRASPEMQNLPYALIRDMFAFCFQIQEDDSPQTVRWKIEAGFGEVSESVAEGQTPLPTQPHLRAHFIGQLLGFDFSASPYLQGVMDARQLRDRALSYMKEFLFNTAERWPTVIFLEDIHWADGSSLAALESLAQSIPDQRLLIVCLARPTLFERYPQWRAGQPFHTRLDLDPLSREDSRQLVAEILKKAGEVPEALRELVVGGAEGNPYYVEEFIKMLIDDGVIVKGDDRWYIAPGRLVQAHVPATLAGILQARLDGLSPVERVTLQQASVIGRIFWDSAVAHLDSDNSAGNLRDLPAALQALCDREMIFLRKTSSFSGTCEYIFKHSILRDVSYESVLKRDRRAYHARAAEWLIEHSGGRAGEFTGVIADHLELAGQIEQAARYLSRAAQRAAQQFANAEAIQYLSRGLDLISVSYASERYEMLLAREQVYDLQGMRAAQVEDLQALKTLAETIADDPQNTAARKAAVALRWANYAELTGDYPLSIASARTAVEQALLAQDQDREAQGRLLWGRALWRQGNLAEAVTRNERALALAQANGLKQIEAQALRTLGAIAFHQGDFAHIQEPYERALRLYNEIGDRRGWGSTLNNLGDFARQQGDYIRARHCFEQVLHNSHEIGERWSEAIAINNLSLVLHHLGDQEAARDQALKAIEMATQIGHRSSQAGGRTNLAHALVALGELEEAAQWYMQAADLRQAIGELPQMMEAKAGLACVRLAQGNLSQAMQQVEAILAYLETGSLDGAEEPLRVYLTCYQVLHAGGDPRASQVLDIAYQLLQQQAARISDADLHRLFLENVSAHAEIVRAWNKKVRAT